MAISKITPDKFEIAKHAILQVGSGGRGFVVRAGIDRYVFSAAHCVPREWLPTPHLSNTTELTFPIIGPKSIAALLWHYGLCDDIAVFSAPDNQSDLFEPYEKFTNRTSALTIGKPPPVVEFKFTSLDEPAVFIQPMKVAAWVFSLDGEWRKVSVHNTGRFLIITEGKEHIHSGMSGSPIIDDSGAAIGVVSTGGGSSEGVSPSLMDCLPGLLLRKLNPSENPA